MKYGSSSTFGWLCSTAAPRPGSLSWTLNHLVGKHYLGQFQTHLSMMSKRVCLLLTQMSKRGRMLPSPRLLTLPQMRSTSGTNDLSFWICPKRILLQTWLPHFHQWFRWRLVKPRIRPWNYTQKPHFRFVSGFLYPDFDMKMYKDYKIPVCISFSSVPATFTPQTWSGR